MKRITAYHYSYLHAFDYNIIPFVIFLVIRPTTWLLVVVAVVRNCCNDRYRYNQLHFHHSADLKTESNNNSNFHLICCHSNKYCRQVCACGLASEFIDSYVEIDPENFVFKQLRRSPYKSSHNKARCQLEIGERRLEIVAMLSLTRFNPYSTARDLAVNLAI